MLLRLADMPPPPPQHNNRSITQRTQIHTHTHTKIRCNSNWHFTRTSFRARIRNCIAQRPGDMVNDWDDADVHEMCNARAMLANIFVNGQRLRQCYGRCASVLQHVARRACSPLITACLGRHERAVTLQPCTKNCMLSARARAPSKCGIQFSDMRAHAQTTAHQFKATKTKSVRAMV